MQQVVCIKPFGLHDVGDLSEVPDGSAFDEMHWRAAAPEDLAAAGPAPDEATETPPESPAPAPAAFPSPVTPADPTEM
jgi:hypothetical protein